MHGLAGNHERYCPLQHHCNARENTSNALLSLSFASGNNASFGPHPGPQWHLFGSGFLLLPVTLCSIHAIFTMSLQTVSNTIQEVCNRQASLLELYFKCIDPYDKSKIRA